MDIIDRIDAVLASSEAARRRSVGMGYVDSSPLLQTPVLTERSPAQEIDCLDYAITELTREMKLFDPERDFRKAQLYQGWIDRWLERRSVLAHMR